MPPNLKYNPITSPPRAIIRAAAIDPGQTSRQAIFTSGSTLFVKAFARTITPSRTITFKTDSRLPPLTYSLMRDPNQANATLITVPRMISNPKAITIKKANNRCRMMAILFPLSISGTPQIRLSTYLSCRNSPIAANKRVIKLTNEIIHDPPLFAAEIADDRILDKSCCFRT